MTVMERFELPTERVADQHVSTATSWSPSAGMRATTRPATTRPATTARPAPARTDDAPLAGWDPDETVPPPASYAGLVGVGAVGGCAVATGLGALVGWTGGPLTFAALVGLDVGVLAGAGIGSLLARRRRRGGRSDAAEHGSARTEA